LLTEDVELQIQETLRALKEDDPAIYDKEKRFAPEIDHEKASDERSSKKDERKTRESKQLLDAEQFRIREFLKEQVEKGGDSDEDDSDSESYELSNQERAKLIADFRDVENAEEDDFFSLDPESKIDKEAEEEPEVEFKPRRDPKRLDKSWVPLSDSKEKDDFLHKYFANEWWRGENLSEIPVHRGLYGYQEILFEDKVSQNKFHHESENGFDIQSHPRKVEGSLRKKKNKRRNERENRKKREKEKKEKATQEVKKKKKEYTKQIQAIAKNLQKETGVKLPRDYLELEMEWDPSNWNAVTDLLQDAELDPDQEAKLFDGLDQIHQLLAQYHGLDYEDAIGEGEDEIKFRFPYIEVPKEDFGLSIEDILTLPPEELDKRAPMKLYASYKQDWEKLEGKKRKKKKQKKRKRDVYDNRFTKDEINRGKHKKVKRDLQKKGVIGTENLKKKKKKNKKKKTKTSDVKPTTATA